MKTFLQVLRLVFWINPLQRVLTSICVILVVADHLALLPGVRGFYRMGLASHSVAFASVVYASLACLLMGGVYWRLASAPRIVRLAPHGRTRLLASVVGLAFLIALLWTLEEALFYLRWVDPKYQLPLTAHLSGWASAAVGTTVAAAGLFIASRSPLAALVVLLVVASPGIAVTLLDVEWQRRLKPGLSALTVLALVWIPFSIWYLNARRISPPRWLASGGQDVLATSLVSSAGPKSRGEALERQLLGGTTVVQLGLMWLVVLGLLLALQWVLVTAGKPSDSRVLPRVMYASLCICPIVTIVVSFAAIRRSRALWLLATSSRVEFFACLDRILMRLNGVMALVHALWLVALWIAFSWQPGFVLEQLDRAQLNWLLLWVPGFMAINAQLARLPKWPVAIAVLAALYFLWPLSMAGRLGYLATMLLLITAIVATFALRVLARRRWRDGDFPRAVTSAAS